MEIKKIWTIQNGLVGTAHINRYGNIVDFRKANVYPDGTVVHFHSTDGFALKTSLAMINIVIDPNFSRGRAYICQCQVEVEGVLSSPIYVSASGNNYIPNHCWDDFLTKEQRTALEIAKEKTRSLVKDSDDRYYQKERNKILDFMLSKESLSSEQQGWVKKFLRTEGRKCQQQVSSLIPARVKSYYKSTKYGYDLLSEIEIVKMWWNQ